MSHHTKPRPEGEARATAQPKTQRWISAATTTQDPNRKTGEVREGQRFRPTKVPPGRPVMDGGSFLEGLGSYLVHGA